MRRPPAPDMGERIERARSLNPVVGDPKRYRWKEFIYVSMCKCQHCGKGCKPETNKANDNKGVIFLPFYLFQQKKMYNQ